MIRYKTLLVVAIATMGAAANATPFFARQYGMKCVSCHSGFPRLNAFGLAFKANNLRIPGNEEAAKLAFDRNLPLTAQVKPTYQRFSGKSTFQFTDTQLLAGGLLTKQTAFYLHHNYFFDAVPQPFPTWELWAQHVFDEKRKIMVKAGQFELPYSYSPEINKTTISYPMLLFQSNIMGNDVSLGGNVTGLQVSGQAPGNISVHVVSGAPGFTAGGNLVGERQFFGRFRDTFFRVSKGEPHRNLGLFGYFTNPPRVRTSAATEVSAERFGLDGVWFWKDYQIHAMAAYGETQSANAAGARGFMRGGFIEVDRMITPAIGATLRFDLVDRNIGAAHVYQDGTTLAFRYYPIDRVKLIGELQWMDHGQRSASIMAALIF